MNKVSLKIVLLFGMMFAGWNIVWAVYNNYMPVFLQAGNPEFDALGVALTRGFGLKPFATGIFMSIDNIAALILTPLIGILSDRVGKRLPFILRPLPIVVLCLALVPVFVGMITPDNNGNVSALALPFALFAVAAAILIIGWLSITTVNIALEYSLVPSALRSKTESFIYFIGAVGGVLAYLGSGALYMINRSLPFWFAAGFMLLVWILYAIFIKEPIKTESLAEEHHTLKQMIAEFKSLPPEYAVSLGLMLLINFLLGVGGSAMQTFASSYALNVLAMPEAVGGTLAAIFFAGTLLFAIPSGFIATKFGRRNTIRAGALILTIFPLLIFFIPNLTLLYVFIAITGAGMALTNINIMPTISDIAPSSKSLGTIMSMALLSSGLGVVLSVPVWGGIIQAAGNNYNLLWLSYPTAAVIAFILLFFVKKGEAKPAQAAKG